MALFSTKLKLLVIHHDAILLDQIQQICDRCDYLLTKCTSPFYALHLLAQTNHSFDIMLIDVYMPSMDSYEFLRYVTLQHNIPVIVISSDSTKSAVINSIVHGACDYWVQPLHEKQFKTMWQHVARKTLFENKAEHEVLGFSKVRSDKEPDVVGFLEAEHERKREREDDNPLKETSSKKSRLSWTPQLHQQFVNAVNQLGFDEAKPRKILKMMDASGLTIAQVASHLQKYRNYLKRSPTECINKTSLESEHAHSQSSQLNSTTLQSDNNSETQKHSTDVGDNQASDIMSNDLPDPSDWLLDYDELISLLV